MPDHAGPLWEPTGPVRDYRTTGLHEGSSLLALNPGCPTTEGPAVRRGQDARFDSVPLLTREVLPHLSTLTLSADPLTLIRPDMMGPSQAVMAGPDQVDTATRSFRAFVGPPPCSPRLATDLMQGLGAQLLEAGR